MGFPANSQLLVVDSGHPGVFHGRLGTRMALALPAQAIEIHSHQKNVPHRNHRVYGQQYLSGPGRRSIAGCCIKEP